jgi:hypothetical protein
MRVQQSTSASDIPEYLTVQQIATRLQFSTDWVIRKFQNEPGVLIEGSPITIREKRRYRVLRIPVGVFNRVIARGTKK